MITHAYSIYDRKALIYNTPFYAVSDGSAVRSFSDLCNDLNTSVGRHPNDYVLYLVGGFDDASGLMLPLANPKHITDALPLVRAHTQQRPFDFERKDYYTSAQPNGADTDRTMKE